MGLMNKTAALLVLVAPLAAAAGMNPGAVDEFGREDGKNRPFKDALEGKAPPAFAADGWLNTEGLTANGGALNWESLRGKVVVLDFWGTW